MNKKGILYILLTAILFTSMEPVSKLLSNSGMKSADMTFLRFALGGLFLFPFAIVQLHNHKKTISIKDLFIFLLMGSIGISLSMVLLQIAIEYIPPATAAIIFCCNSVFTTIFAVIILKERFSARKLAALVFCISGIALCVDFSLPSPIFGILLAAASALLFSLYCVIGKKLMKKHTALVQNSFSFVSGSCILFILLLLNGVNPFLNITYNNLFNLLYLGIGVSGLGYLLYFLAMKETSAIQASTVFSIKPVLAPVFSYFILGDSIQKNIIFAILFVSIGSYLNLKNINN